ncbi:MAG: hypothetical protein HWE26_06915 [Alteromonadaceae bacterium]|nr:hypothetical protein [Alteromonadaceae bacterium]
MINSNDNTRLPANIRLIIGIASVPSLLLAVMLIISLYEDGLNGISAFEIIYAIVGFIGIYIAITGRRLF